MIYLQIQKENVRNQTFNGTQFMTLNSDVQIMIFENLNVYELFSIAEIDSYLSEIAGIAYRTRLSEKVVTFMNPFNNHVNVDLGETNDKVFVHGMESFTAFLKHFGPYILRLDVHHSIGVNLSIEQLRFVKNINELISLNCADTLLQFDMSASSSSNFQDVFDGFTKPFAKAENVTLRGQFATMGNSIYTFDELFPAVRRLILPDIENVNLSGVGWNMPQLEHLGIKIHPFQPLRFYESDIENILRNNPETEEFLKRNPQIRSLKLSCSSRKFLAKVNELLPNLESLELEYYKQPIGVANEIIFRNVKIFTIFSILGDPNSIPDNISFQDLIELHTNVDTNNWWIDFIRNNNDVKRMHLEQGCAHSEILRTITSMNSNLTEISLMPCQDMIYNHIVEFIRNNPKVDKFHFVQFHSVHSLDPLVQICARN